MQTITRRLLVTTLAIASFAIAAPPQRGEYGERQVKDAETAIAHGNGGVLSSQSTIILGTQSTI